VLRVSEIAHQLPTDIEALHALVTAARVERDAAVAERHQALSQMDRLRHLLRQLQRAQFGRRSEKLDPEQLLLALEDIEQAVAGNEAADDKKDAVAARARGDKRRVNRGALPAHLPHVDVTITPEDTNCPCCRAPMHVIGEETSQRLDVVPAQFRVIVTHRPKYACRACTEAVVQASAPERLIKGGLPLHRRFNLRSRTRNPATIRDRENAVRPTPRRRGPNSERLLLGTIGTSIFESGYPVPSAIPTAILRHEP